MRTPEGWRRISYGQVMVETDDRAGAVMHLPLLSVTKARGPMLASERFGRPMHGRDLSKYRIAKRDSIVADPMLLWDGSIGWQAVVDNGLVSPDYRVYEVLPGVDARYLNYLVRSPLMLPHYQGGARGTNVRRNRIARSDFLAIPFNLPPLPEQKKIAAILSSVDEAIEATQAVVEQLQVVKKAMMGELLTKGIPGRHSRFKKTEIGEVPEGWRVVEGERLFQLAGGYGPSSVTFSSDGRVLFLKVDDFNLATNSRGLRSATLRFSRSDNPRIKVYEPGCLVFPKRGAAIFKNRVQVLRAEATVDPNLMVLIPKPQVDPAFLAYLMIQIGLFNLSDNSGIPQINNKHLYPHRFAMPPYEEQREIRAALETVDERIEVEGELLRSQTSLKSALLSVLLTGEVRVRLKEEARCGA